MNFPVDVQQPKCLWQQTDSRGKPLGWAREMMIASWGSYFPASLMPWRMRVAVWNWMWNLQGEERLDWRTRRRKYEAHV